MHESSPARSQRRQAVALAVRVAYAVAVSVASLATGWFAGAATAGTREGLAALERSDYPDALRELVPAAEQGDAAAQAALGRMYLYGWGVAKEPAVAARWLQRAAESGHAGSQRLLAHLYESGTGVPKDVAQAERWRQASAAAASKAAPRPPVRYKDYEDRNLVIDGKVYPQETALMRAIKRGDREAVLALLRLGADVNATAGDHTALTIAVIYFPAVVEVLLAHGADPRGRSGSGDQPLSILLETGWNARSPDDCPRLATVRSLVAAGADVNARNNAGESVLRRARNIYERCPDRNAIIRLLVERGATE